jgi:hypothetical protein
LGKDEVHLSLSLLSIRYYEKMNFNNRNMWKNHELNLPFICFFFLCMFDIMVDTKIKVTCGDFLKTT